MKLYSKFRDYYDTAIAYGIDEACIYVRNQKETRFGNSNSYRGLYAALQPDQFYSPYAEDRITVNYFKIGFCGKWYVGARVSYWFSMWNEHKTVWVYDKEELDKYYKDGYEKLYRYSRSFLPEHQGVEDQVLMDFHYETGIPIVACTNEFCITNPCLRNFAFYKMKDAVATFQELSMFISGVIGGQSPRMVEISDKDRIAKHGFDKLSFRKEKTKRRA